MTSLLGYLVERSVRSRSQAAAGAVAGFGDGLQAAAQGPASPELRPGAIRPRTRSRHEPWPEVARSDPDTLVPTEEMREWPVVRGAEEPRPEPPDQASVTERTSPSPRAPLAVTPKDAAPAVGMTVHQTVIEHRVAQQAGSDTADAKIPADGAQRRPDRDRAAVDRSSHVQREAPQPAPEVPFAPAEQVQPQPRSKLTEHVRDAPSPDSDRPRGQVNPVTRVQAGDAEAAAPARDRPVRAEETRPLREPVAVSAVATPRRAAAPAAPPRIEVTIGRVEVRAVYAQPSQPTARKQPALPPTSLDDYLKQRDGTG
jgi:hypothetical protein